VFPRNPGPPNKESEVRFAFTAILLAGVLHATGCGSGSPTDRETTQGPVEQPRQVTPESKVELKFDVDEYDVDYKQSKEKAEQKYADKRVEVTGLVTRVNRHNSRMIVSLGTTRFGVSCNFKDSEPWKLALPGQTVTVRGKVSGVYPALQVDDSQVKSATGPTPDEYSAAELSELYAKEPEKLKAKYGGKQLILQGTIETLAPPSEIGVAAILTKMDGKAVVAEFNFDVDSEELRNKSKERIKSLRSGQKIRVLGTFSQYENYCRVYGCLFLPMAK